MWKLFSFIQNIPHDLILESGVIPSGTCFISVIDLIEDEGKHAHVHSFTVELGTHPHCLFSELPKTKGLSGLWKEDRLASWGELPVWECISKPE